jgi:hypothetical protein
MADKVIHVACNNTVGELIARIKPKQQVFFKPRSDQKLTITFTGRVPFRDWDSRSRTARRGQPVKGKVLDLPIGEFEYKPENDPSCKGSGPRANPKLIVDGGLISKTKRGRQAREGTARRKSAKTGKSKKKR